MYDNNNNFTLWISWKSLKLVYLQCNTSTLPTPSLPLSSPRQSLSPSCICKRPKKNRSVKYANNYKSKDFVFSIQELCFVPKKNYTLSKRESQLPSSLPLEPRLFDMSSVFKNLKQSRVMTSIHEFKMKTFRQSECLRYFLLSPSVSGVSLNCVLGT